MKKTAYFVCLKIAQIIICAEFISDFCNKGLVGLQFDFEIEERSVEVVTKRMSSRLVNFLGDPQPEALRFQHGESPNHLPDHNTLIRISLRSQNEFE